MNKTEFIDFIAKKYNCTKTEANKVVDMFTGSIISALGKNINVALVGFGNFTVSKVAAREGRNPKTGKPIKIGAYQQPKFRAGKTLKDECNKR